MTTARLGAIAVQIADHPIAMARLLQPLAREVSTLDDAAEARFADGTIVRFLQSKAPSPVHLTIAVSDLAATALALGDHRTHWTVHAPNVIRVERDSCSLDITEVETGKAPGLASATFFVSDVAASAQWWQALGLEVTDVAPASTDDDPDPSEPAADVLFENARLELRGCGLRPVTLAHMLLRVDDPLGRCCVGLDFAAWPYTREGDAVVAQTLDGCGIRVTPPRRS